MIRLTTFLLGWLLVMLPSFSLVAQPGTIKEEQDFTFAMGLLRDQNYPLAYEQFRSFLASYPESPKKTEATYRAAQCLFYEKNYTDALIQFDSFLLSSPQSMFAPDAALSIGEIYFRREEPRNAIAAYRRVVDEYTQSAVAGEAAYWAGESALKLKDLSTALKYYTIAYENYPACRLRDYALFSVGYVNELQNELDEAHDRYKRLVSEFPQSAIVPDANTHIASVYFLRKQYKKTLEWIDQLSDSPNAQNAATRLFYRAESEYQLGQYAKAEELYASFMSAYPNDIRAREAQYSRGWSSLLQKKYLDAIAIFDQLGNGNDMIADASRFRKGVALRLNKEPVKAEEVFHDMLAKNPASEFADNAHFELGMIAFEKKDYGRASRSFKKILSEFPQSDLRADAYNMEGESELALKQYGIAFDAFASVDTIASAQPVVKSNANFRAAYTLFQMQQYPRAIERFDRFIAAYPNEPRAREAVLWKAEAQFNDRRYDAAIETYTTVLETASDETLKQDALYGIGWAQFKAGKLPEAVATFTRLTKEYRGGKHDPDANARLGDVYYAMQNYTKAAEVYRYTARMYSKNSLAAYALLQIAFIDHRMGSTAMGINTLKNLIAKYPESQYCDEAQYNLGWMYFQTRDYTVAISEFDQLVKNYPTSSFVPHAMYSQADAYYNLGKYGEAEQMYRDMIAKHPASTLVPDALNGVAECLRQQGRADEAAKISSSYLSEHPVSEVADLILMKRANAFFTQRQYDAAIAEYETLIQKYDSSVHAPDAHLQIARAHYALNNYDAAKQATNRMATRYAGSAPSVDALLFLADIEIETQQHENALALLNDLLSAPAAAQRKDEVLFRRGKLQLTLHDDAAAQQDFSESSRCNPFSEAGMRSKIALARIEGRAGKLDRPLEVLRSITSMRSDDIGAEAQLAIGELLASAKRYPEAEKELLRVEYVFTGSLEMCSRSLLALGGMYEAMKSASKAKAAYKKIIDNYPGTDAATEASGRIKRLQ